MKAYKLEILIIDNDNIGGTNIIEVLENQHYPNYCISPIVKDIVEADIGEWHDDHPLNKKSTYDIEYKRLFKK